MRGSKSEVENQGFENLIFKLRSWADHVLLGYLA